MRVLLLSPYGSEIARVLRDNGDHPILGANYVDPLEWPSVDFVVMFGHRSLIKDPVLSRYRGRIINIHGSYLPWNRGAYPNLFSWVDDTPKGATIHHVNGGLDTGAIIVRDSVDFSRAPKTTLASSYNAIKVTCEELFGRAWPVIRNGGCKGVKQNSAEGSYHRRKDAEPILARLPYGWDTPVAWFAVDRMVAESQRLGLP